MVRVRLLLTLLVAACGDDAIVLDAAADESVDASDGEVDGTGDTDARLPDFPTGELAPLRRDGDVEIDRFEVQTPAPPANPTSNAQTPDALNRVRVFRYRRAGASAPRALVVAMPGVLAGGPSLDGLARGLVRESEDAVEVWLIDRRGNALEDLRGMNAAEAAEDPEIAAAYYRGEASVGGETFGGFLESESLSFVSEWGLASLVNDVAAVLDRVPADLRRERVFLLGHSLGASFSEAFAGWRFDDGSRGAEQLAGVVLIDGVLGDTPISESEYTDGFMAAGFPSMGVDGIRAGQPISTLPFLGIGIYVQAELLALRARFSPDAVISDPLRDVDLRLLLGYSRVPAMTNGAAFALPFDNASGILAFARLSVGEPFGATEGFTSLLGEELVRPVGGGEPIRWNDGPAIGEASALAEFARAFSEGPSNYAQWYFPARLPLDLAAVAGGRIEEDSWQRSRGLNYVDGPRMDAPVLAIANALVGSVDAYEALRARIAPAVGEGRPAAGATRDDELGLRIVDALDLEHLDPGIASEGSRNAAISETLRFIEEHTVAGALEGL